MTSEQKEQFRLGRIAQESGLSTDELEEAIKRAKEEKLRKKSTDGNDNKPKDHEEGKLSRTMREVNELVNEKMQSRKTVSGDKEPFGGDIAQGTPPAPDEDEDTDEYIKPPINFDRKIKHEQERSASELARIERERELNGAVQTSEKYRSGWFRALLELEGLAQGQEEAAGRSVSISFGKTEPEAGTEKTLLLSHPSRSIPPALEELSNIRLELDLKTAQKSVTVEALSIKGYTVRAKLTSKDALGDIDLSKVAEAKINVQSPAFLQKSLQSCFESLHFQDDKNLQEDLPKNIEFVFGPPGTGKTTYLAKNVLMPLMKAGESARVLVLAPTNKAADVLVRRVMDESGEDKSYEDWLIRFVTTNDEIIEKSKCFRDRTCNLESLKRGVAVTTVARFTYDTFEQESGSKRLHDVHWDYIVVDEASMVHLPHIIFVLYNQKPKKFIIAGDPFQIGPIARVDIWKDENIYTLIQLKSFANPTTVPHKYNVICLNKQYRSIPSVGKIFSGLSYNGILSHNRTEDDRRPLAITGLDTAPLNIIKFPVSGYESIYRAKRLNGSPYQVYSALFTVEFCRYLVSEISKNNRNENWKIGVISPYRIQADIIDKTITRMNVPANIEVNAGTIHGFQGDECDIIIALFNPPQTISDSKEIFLNKRNIINVSISRARDYLFVVMPDDDTENVKNLTFITKVEKLCREQTGCTGYRSHDIEGLIFGSRSYIEDNAFSTSHQSVNVYGKPEKHYEVRSEDKAVDIQIEDPL
jgi:signal recognition particle GTPase/riboflavin synthase